MKKKKICAYVYVFTGRMRISPEGGTEAAERHVCGVSGPTPFVLFMKHYRNIGLCSVFSIMMR